MFVKDFRGHKFKVFVDGLKMTGKRWKSMSTDGQEQYSQHAKDVKDKMKMLDGKHWLSLTEDEQSFWKTHTVRVDKEPKAKGESKQLSRLHTKAPERLKELKTRVSTSTKLFCMDLEFHVNSKKLTEVGVTLYYPQTKTMKTHHFVVDEVYDHRNHGPVPDHKDHFNFGDSERLPLAEVEKTVYELVSDADCLVGHAFQNDKQFLTQCGYFGDTPLLDTQLVARYYTKELRRYSLGNLSAHLGLETENLHNAGNDAHYTMQCLLKMYETA